MPRSERRDAVRAAEILQHKRATRWRALDRRATERGFPDTGVRHELYHKVRDLVRAGVRREDLVAHVQELVTEAETERQEDADAGRA